MPLLLVGMGLLLSIKLFLAFRLELYSDEIFYWLASTYPALAYSDLPFMTSFLAGIGVDLGGHSSAAVRSIFLLLGSSIPILLYWVALPLVGRRQAMEAALLSLCLPLAAFMGLLAVPDVPLVFLGLLMIGLTERAIRLDTMRLWLAAGLVTALGLSTHYRFILYPVALFVFLLVSRQHHHLWKTARLWLAGLIGLMGLYPALTFNLRHELSGLDYHLVDRHPWAFQADGLLHPLIQSLVVTPLLYAGLIYTAIWLLRQARNGSYKEGLFACFALAHLGVYLLLAPWADSTRTTIHWPLSGYLPLLVFMPAALRSLAGKLTTRLQQRTLLWLFAAIPVTGFTGSLLGLAGIGSQGFNEQLQAIVGPGVLSNKMAGWQPVNEHLQQLIREESFDDNVLIVTDNYYTAAQIAFFVGNHDNIYTIDRDKAIRDGRLMQYAIWERDTAALLTRTGQAAIFISEDSTLNIERKLEVMDRACRHFGQLDYLDQLLLFNGDKAFSFYHARDINPGPAIDDSVCPLPSYTWLETPDRGITISGIVPVRGWAFNNGHGIAAIELHVNGQKHSRIERSVDRTDVVEIMNAHADPAAPLLGFEHSLDTREFADGNYRIHLEVTSTDGEWQMFSERNVTINND